MTFVRIESTWGVEPVDVLDADCAWRSCLHVAPDKGSYTVGRGYTSYHANPKLVCMHRHSHGCPQPIPPPDAKRVRCCDAPSFRANPTARKQPCRSCGKRSSRRRIDVMMALAQVTP